MARILTGCSGFSYKEWKGSFYPEGTPAKAWFEYYCSRFPTLELNVTFYRFPTAETFHGWYERSPEGYVFAVKAPRLITHLKLFNDVGQLQQDFYGAAKKGLRDKLGPLLYQLPAKMEYRPAILEKILRSLDTKYDNVIEFRHESWWRAEVYDALDKKGITFCSLSYPGLPDWVVPGGKMVYYRFHGVPSLYRSTYSPAFVDKILAQTDGRDAFLFFNNTADGHAVRNAEMTLRKLN
ncbi:MAG TPA: DUF72 domain-containing protein [Dinghuibacter sp.]|uniref:DUF72 domain-containing protein n=1 Tax=Dinghuibacter sp. TaxID=2024697 RepID=UPI002C13AE04|nr:DUF72 domain-containing protein [Dinghuibacter sp.]HTJ15118.1 DUF72 domain-containing protein [Dinghuibacter sp.]